MRNFKMKSIYFFLLAVFFTAGVKAQSVAINTDGSTADPSAILDLKSTTKGLLLPRVTSTERIAIVSPVAGLTLYDTTTNSNWFFNGTLWVNAAATANLTGEVTSVGAATTIADNAVTTAKIADNNITNAKMVTGAGGIYKGSGSLAAATTVTQGANTLSFTSTAVNAFSVDGTTLSVNAANNSVGIGTAAPAPSSALDITSTSQGFLPPRMTAAQRDLIVNPAEGLTIYNTTKRCLDFWTGLFWRNNCTPLVGSTDVLSSTGLVWMDRNLGATQVATSSTDAASYGDLYQWGRLTDGHQIRTSTLSALNATVSTDIPGNANFIITNTGDFDWRSPKNDNLWQGVNGINNPCPTGYRLPTEGELNAERVIFSANNAAGAFASVLKLPLAGIRRFSDGSLLIVGSYGYYWSSTVSGTSARYLFFNSSAAYMDPNYRANGISVRCLKD
jgi:hypothetical protein